MIAESYCNGVPTSKVNDDGTFSYGTPQTGRQLLTAAVAKFDSAITSATAAGGSTALNLARIGKGRALLDLNQAAQAATARSRCRRPSTTASSTQNTGRQNNAVRLQLRPVRGRRRRHDGLALCRSAIARRHRWGPGSMARRAVPHDQIQRPQLADAAGAGHRGAPDQAEAALAANDLGGFLSNE
jgi:hypothetical protein